MFSSPKWFAPDRLSWRRRSGLVFWSTPAERHVRWSALLTSLGVRVVPTVAAGELAERPGLLRQPASFVVTSSPASARTVAAAAANPALSRPRREALARQIVRVAERLHSAGIARLDLLPANVLVYSPADVIALFDLERLYFLRRAARARRLRMDMQRVESCCALLLEGTGLTMKDLLARAGAS